MALTLKVPPKARLTLLVVVVSTLLSSCLTSTKTVVKPANAPVPEKNASKPELIGQYDQLADSIHTLNLTVTIRLTAGSAYTGTIEQYHEINGFILADKPSKIRVIGQVPVVGKNIFDMESDGETFRIFIPSKNQFLEGPARLERPSAKPIENLRPQHLLDAIFWREIPKDSPVLLEETSVPPENFYVLTVVRPAATSGNHTAEWEIDRKIWFDRSDLSVSRIDTYDPAGKPEAIVHLSGWDAFGNVRYPKQIALERPRNDYQLQLAVTKVTANEDIAPERFVLAQPPGTELIRVSQETSSSTSGEKIP